MKVLVVALLALCVSGAPALAETTVRVRTGGSGLEFDFLYSNHYHADEAVVEECVTSLDETDLVVALQLARLSGLELGVVVEWRKEGMHWHEITHRCNLGPEVYYVEMARDPGPPYGRAWGHWKKNGKQKIVLSDDEIRAFTVLKAMSEYTGQSADHIVAERKRGRSPGDIASAAKKSGARVSEDTSPPHGKPAKSKGKGKGKKK